MQLVCTTLVVLGLFWLVVDFSVYFYSQPVFQTYKIYNELPNVVLAPKLCSVGQFTSA